MQKFIGVAVILIWVSCSSETVVAQEPVPGKVTVDFRWIEPQFIAGVTEKKGHPVECGGDDWYAHLKPVLSSKWIAAATLSKLYIGNVQYGVRFKLREGAVEKLIEACGDRSDRRLTVYVNGRWYGSNNFNRDLAGTTRSFHAPIAGYTLSKSLAEQIVHAVDPPEPVELKGHTKAVSMVAWSADGQAVATASDDRSIRVWDPLRGRQVAFLPEIAREGYGDPVVAFTPNLEVAAVNSWGEVTIRKVSDGKVLAKIAPIPEVEGRRSAFRPDVFSMAISPDGKRLATAGSVGVVGGPHGLPGGVVSVWDMETGQVIHQSATLSTAAGAVAWSADGKRYAAGTNGAGGELPESGEIWVWDTETGKVLHHFNVKSQVAQGEWASAGDVTMSPDGKRVAVPVTAGSRAKPAGLVIGDTGASVQVWDLATGNCTQVVSGLTASVRRVVFSPDGKLLATAGSDNRVRVWDVESGKEHETRQCDGRVTAVVFRPDGQRIAVGITDGSVRIWPVTGVE
jgi:WD40 repeat protein